MPSFRAVRRWTRCLVSSIAIIFYSLTSLESILVVLGGSGVDQGPQSNATSASRSVSSPAVASMLGKFEGTDLSKVIKVADLHDPNVPVRPIREGAAGLLFNWTFVAQEVQEGGHSWCAITRDNWSCVGERYKEVLRSTRVINDSWSMDAFPPNSNIYIYLYQLACTHLLQINLGHYGESKGIQMSWKRSVYEDAEIGSRPIRCADFRSALVLKGDWVVCEL